MTRVRTITIFVLALILTIFGSRVLDAQTWRPADSVPPSQSIPPVTQQGDNLGGKFSLCGTDTNCTQWSHKARFDLNMDHKAIIYIGDGGDSAINTAKPGLEAESSSGSNIEGAIIGANNGVAVYARSESDTQAALGAFFRGGASVDAGFGIHTDSPGGTSTPAGLVSAIISSRMTLVDVSVSSPARLQIGSNALNRLALSPASGLGSKLYFGQAVLCNPDVNLKCGFGNIGYTPDNLGLVNPHQALMNLNMQNNRIINVVSQTATDAAITAMNTGVDAGTRTLNSGSSSYGVSTAVHGYTLSDKSTTAGIYAYHTGVRPGLIAASASGWAARISGMLHVSAGTSPAQVQIAKEENTLSTSQLVSASDDLYWGSQKLCATGSINCGWSSAVGTIDRWKMNPVNAANMYFKNYRNAASQWLSFVGIGTASPQYTLDVSGPTRTTQGDIGNARVDSLTVTDSSSVASELYVSDDVTVSSMGAVIDGTISVSANGLMINGVRLNEADLIQIINACRSAGICS